MFRFILLAAALARVIWGAPQFDVKSLDVDGRIIGGTDTTIEAHPYIVSVQLHNRHGCGGSILSATWILSAAHCFTENISIYSVRAGSTVRESGGQVLAISRIIPHESYNSRTFDYDIALLQLASPITNSIARAITLVEEGDAPLGGTLATVTGWGATSLGGSFATILQVIHVPIISQANCRAAYGASVITDRMFCAGLLGVGGQDACASDSGGPLIANGVLTGVISWGFSCALPNSPGVYASIPNLRSWIRNNSGI